LICLLSFTVDTLTASGLANPPKHVLNTFYLNRLTLGPPTILSLDGLRALCRSRETSRCPIFKRELPSASNHVPIFSPGSKTPLGLLDGQKYGPDLANESRAITALKNPRKFFRRLLLRDVSPDLFVISGDASQRIGANLKIISIRQLLEVSVVWNGQVERVDDVSPSECSCAAVSTNGSSLIGSDTYAGLLSGRPSHQLGSIGSRRIFLPRVGQ
jgi:hypothetical protein